MNTYRKFRFPILIGAGVIAATVLLYQTSSRIDSRNIQGAIGKRDVYRDAQVNAADVNASPGLAPVALKVLLESKEFKAVAKDPAFQTVMANSQFQELARNQAFLSAMANPAIASLTNNAAFLQYVRSESFARMIAGVHASMSQGEVQQAVQSSLKASSSEALTSNAAFNLLMYNANFLMALQNQSLKAGLVSTLSLDAFAGLVSNPAYQGLMRSSNFLSALSSGMSANLAASAIQ